MNKSILNTGIQSFIDENLNTDIVSVLMKKSIFNDVSSKELAQQIEAKKKCQKKLPLWFETPKIYYPKKISVEQSSSALAAQYKAALIDGKSLVDLTGGFGVDSYYFSKNFEHLYHCEIDPELSEISRHNFNILKTKNVTAITEDGLTFLKHTKTKFDWLYIDPSRRDDLKRKVFELSDCTPDITQHLKFLFTKSDKILLKSAPLLDITSGIKSLVNVKEIHILAIKNEVKELLWVIEKNQTHPIKVKTTNIISNKTQNFNFDWGDEKKAISTLNQPKSYLYEPNTAILKSGAFKLLGEKYNLFKLHQHTHLYTSIKSIDFPGRTFEIVGIYPYSKKELKKYKGAKANITTKNFPISVSSIRKQFKIGDGGSNYLFFTKIEDNSLKIIQCTKVH